MSLIFPIHHCPNCHSTQFKIHASYHGTIEIVFDSDGSGISKDPVTQHVDRYRKSWACANCNNHLFYTKDCRTTDK